MFWDGFICGVFSTVVALAFFWIAFLLGGLNGG